MPQIDVKIFKNNQRRTDNASSYYNPLVLLAVCVSLLILFYLVPEGFGFYSSTKLETVTTLESKFPIDSVKTVTLSLESKLPIDCVKLTKVEETKPHSVDGVSTIFSWEDSIQRDLCHLAIAVGVLGCMVIFMHHFPAIEDFWDYLEKKL